MALKTQLEKKILSREAKICIVGMGYVGIPLMIRFIDSGFDVLGLDKDLSKIEKLKNNESYINTIPASDIEKCTKNGFEPSNDISKIIDVDVIIICVPTPIDKYRDPDLSFVVESAKEMLPFLKQGQMICLESTTYPGTTEEILLPIIESSNLKVGEDLFLCYSPEREDPGNKEFDTINIPKIVSGVTKNCLDLAKCLYGSVVDQIVPVSSTKTAEMTKLLENIYRAVNIGLVNELKTITDKMGIDIHEVIDAAATKPFGFNKFTPGPGLGGHCIPVDPFYLAWKAKEFGFNSGFIELAGEINRSMPDWVISKISDSLNNLGLSIKNSKILVLGVAYKKDVDDIRESPAIEIINKLLSKGSYVNFSDPYCIDDVYSSEGQVLKNVNISEEEVSKYDLVALITNHSDFDYELIRRNANFIVDTRGVFLKNYKNVLRA